jgi:uncharacterized protein (TIGR03663 family)
LAYPPPKLRRAVFVGLACLALAVRWPQLGERPMHTDEAVNAYLTGAILAGENFQYDPHDRHGPALYVVAWPLARIAGEKNFSALTETTLRLGPVLTGAATILLFAAAANQFGFLAAVIAGLLFAFGPLTVYFSRYFIHETLFVAATLGMLMSGLHALVKPSVRQGVLAGLCAGLMLACKETAILHFAAAGAAALGYLFLSKQRAINVSEKNSSSVWSGVAALAAFLILVSALYTWGGRHWRGPLDLVRAIPRFAARAAGEGHEKPFEYYFALLSGGWSGAVVLALALIGGISGVWRFKFRKALESSETSFPARPRSRLFSFFEDEDERTGKRCAFGFLLIYTVLICAFYSFIPYKTPWLALNLWLPLALLAGCGWVALWRVAKSSGGRGLILLGSLAVMGLFGHDTWLRVFSKPVDEHNPYAYAHTGGGGLRLPERVNQLAGKKSREIFHIAVIAADPWPLPWYLRKFPQVGFWQPGQDPGAADVYITSPEAATELPEKLENRRPEYFGVRPEVLLILWPPSADTP